MKYLQPLDGMRGVAVLLVLFIHAQFSAFSGGFLGVDLFFVLSGYLITTLLLHEHAKTGRIDFRAFYIRRALRLLPALAITLVLAVLMELHRGNLTPREIVRNVLFALFYIGNWVRALTDISLSKLDHTWSLSIEEQFYLLWPLALWALLRWRKQKPESIGGLLGILIAFIAVYRAWLYWPANFSRAYFAFDTRADAMLVGCLLAGLLFWQKLPAALFASVAWRLSLPLLVIVFGWLTVFSAYGQARYPLGLFTLVALIAAVFIGEITQNPAGWLARILSAGPLRYVGKLSYGLYLYHFVLFSTTPPPIPNPNPMRQLADFIATFALAALSYHLVEQPFLRLKSRWQRV